MPAHGIQTYSPVLRLKEGEYTALGEITSTVAERLLPLFVIPPPKERDPEFARELTVSELAYVPGQRIGRHWPLRQCLLDPRYLFRKLGHDSASEWLPTLFRASVAAHGLPTLVSDLRTIEGKAYDGLRTVIRDVSHGLALRITAEDIERDDLKTRIHTALLRLAIKPSECFLILDFGSPDFSDLPVVAEIIVASFQKVMEIGLWGQVIWQATSYPEANPAPRGGYIELPRSEWLAWCVASELDADFRRSVMYGDFGADSAKFNFGTSGGAPRRHYRYSTPEKWLVPRGQDDGSVADAMRWVAEKIVRSGHFAGRMFSSGDRFISDTAHDSGKPGNPTTWRKVNTIHHLTRVVTDLGAYRGYRILERADEPAPEQAPLPF